MILTIANSKGGSGKSTIAFMLATQATLKGTKTICIDADPQATLADALSFNEPVKCLTAFTPSELETKARIASDAADLVIIDVQGRDSALLRASLLIADVALVPIRPTPVDAWAAMSTANVIQEALQHNPKLKAFAVLNAIMSRIKENDVVAESIPKPLQLISTTIKQRAAYARAIGNGDPLHTIRPKPKAAMDDIDALLASITTHSLLEPS